MMVAGNVTVTLSGSTIVETFTPSSGANLAKELYIARKAAQSLPNPAMPPGCQLAAQANPGDTTLHVTNSVVGGSWDAGLAYGPTGYVYGTTLVPPTRLGRLNYIHNVLTNGQYPAASVDLFIDSITDANHIVLVTAIPNEPLPGPTANPVLPVGQKFGNQQTIAEWTASVNGTLLGILQSLAANCNADATTFVAHVQTNATAEINATLGGLQRSTASGSLTDPIGGFIGVNLPIT